MRRRLALIVPAVLLALALVGDQVARVVVEHRIGSRLAERGVTAVSVHVDGWPFVARLASGSVDATVRAEVPFAVLAHVLDGGGTGSGAGGGSDDSSPGDDGGDAGSSTGDGTGAGSGAGAKALANVTWSGENGQLVARLPSGVALVLDVAVQDGLVHVNPVSVLVRGLQLPVDVVRARAPERFGALLDPRTIDPTALGKLPAGTRLTDVTVTSSGLLVTLAAHQPQR